MAKITRFPEEKPKELSFRFYTVTSGDLYLKVENGSYVRLRDGSIYRNLSSMAVGVEIGSVFKLEVTE